MLNRTWNWDVRTLSPIYVLDVYSCVLSVSYIVTTHIVMTS